MNDLQKNGLTEPEGWYRMHSPAEVRKKSSLTIRWPSLL